MSTTATETQPEVAPTMQNIAIGASLLAMRRAALSAIVMTMGNEIAAIKRRHLRELTRAVDDVAVRQADLKAMVKAAPELFRKPKSVVLHGITIGYKKGSGKVVFEDEDQVLRLIRKHFSEDEAKTLILTEEHPKKDAIADLSVAELKKIGCTVEGTGDIPFVRAVGTDVEKLAKVLLKGATEEAEER